LPLPLPCAWFVPAVPSWLKPSLPCISPGWSPWLPAWASWSWLDSSDCASFCSESADC
jgi:hypothetical protein